ncbi:MAG TPA: sigma-54 dependent transcriptional regulator [Polyangia bacterium]|nr:sigma-54 dependent transcriptional regulator [Polyangia bacterium]
MDAPEAAGGNLTERPTNPRRPALDVLMVDDESSIRENFAIVLRSAGHTVTLAADGAEATMLCGAHVFDVVICDVRLPKVDGMTLLKHLRGDSPGTDVILITGYAAVSEAVAALKAGAHDYLSKPLRAEELMLRLGRIAEQRELKRELARARAQLEGRQPGPTIVGRSPSVDRMLARLSSMAQSDAPVLIIGESGTGKELVARTLHDRGARNGKSFVAVNCAAFPETLLEAELFGHERGAFTGAMRKRDGRFKAADGGTLLLDEIGEMPLPAQAKLLRVLEEGTIEPLGTNTPIHVDVRIISSTNRNLRERIADGRFREDLYYRLKVLDIEIPPLRERRGDLALLTQYFLQQFSPAGKEPPAISPHAWAALAAYPFPGNVRELAHAIEHAVVLARGREIALEHLPAEIAGSAPTAASPGGRLPPLQAALKQFEREYLTRALAMAGGKRTHAAELLGISRKTLWEKLRALGIADADADE